MEMVSAQVVHVPIKLQASNIYHDLSDAIMRHLEKISRLSCTNMNNESNIAIEMRSSFNMLSE